MAEPRSNEFGIVSTILIAIGWTKYSIGFGLETGTEIFRLVFVIVSNGSRIEARFGSRRRPDFFPAVVEQARIQKEIATRVSPCAICMCVL